MINSPTHAHKKKKYVEKMEGLALSLIGGKRSCMGMQFDVSQVAFCALLQSEVVDGNADMPATFTERRVMRSFLSRIDAYTPTVKTDGHFVA